MHSRLVRIVAGAVPAAIVAVAWAGPVALAWPTSRWVATGVKLPGARDASAIWAARAAGSWGRAIEVPGLGALNKDGFGGVSSISCASAGNCSLGGSYQDRRGHVQGFVAVERHGVWDRAIEVPGLGALNVGGDADVFAVACGSASNCAAGGSYRDRRGHLQGFVAVERRGRWRRAIEVPGLGALNTGEAEVDSVSCGSAGNCVAAGDYQDGQHHFQGFVAVERRGRWRRAIEVPGLGTLNKGGSASVSSVSCTSAGNCSAGGFYRDRRGHDQGFVVSQRRGRWGTAIEVPGLGALDRGGFAEVNTVSCASAGNCAAGGDYLGGLRGFVASERDGVWGAAIEVPGLGSLSTGSGAVVFSVSCPSAGNCAAGGFYSDVAGEQGFVAAEGGGMWGTAIKVPGLRALNTGGSALVSSVSCASAGNCAAGGNYTVASGNSEAFVAVERGGVWRTAIEVPGLGALNKGGDAQITWVSCPPAGTCAAAGSYAPERGHSQGFVVSQTG